MQYRILKTLGWLLARLPMPCRALLGQALGLLAYWAVGKRRRIALANLKLAYGDQLSPKERRRIARGSFFSLGKTGLEFFSMPVSRGHLMDRITIHGEERLREVVNAQQGAILIVAHLGNWEMGGAVLVERGFDVSAIARPQKQSSIERLIQDIRTTMGMEVILKKNALKESLRALRKGKVLAILIDQHSRKNGVIVDFFGKPASTLASPAVLSLKTGCPAIPAFLVRNAGGGFTGYFEEPIYPEENSDRQAEILRLTQCYTDVVERYVRQYPDQWMWVHRRWRPGNRRRRTGKTRARREQ